MTESVAGRISRRFQSRFLRGYARGKLAGDPVYAAAHEYLPLAPLLDVGCGIGLLALYLRDRGFSERIEGLDHDEKKIAAARAAAVECGDVDFRVGDAREPFQFSGSVAVLDLLHYFDTKTQERILTNVSKAVAPGCVVIIREGIRDQSWRYRMTYLQEVFSRLIGWLRAERLHFPTAGQIRDAFASFEPVAERHLSRGTPFNNYLFVFRRPLSGITNE